MGRTRGVAPLDDELLVLMIAVEGGEPSILKMHSGEASYTPVLVSIPIAHTSNRKWTQEVFKKKHTNSRGKSSGREREGSVSEGLGVHLIKYII